MKLNILKMSMFAFLITGMLLSCNDTPAENVEEAEENVVEAQQELEEARQDSMEYVTYRTEAERKLDENDQKIAALKERQRTAAKEVEDKYDRDIEEMERRNKELRDNVQTYQQGGRDRWESFKQKFNEDLDALGNSISNVFERDTTDNKR